MAEKDFRKFLTGFKKKFKKTQEKKEKKHEKVLKAEPIKKPEPPPPASRLPLGSREAKARIKKAKKPMPEAGPPLAEVKLAGKRISIASSVLVRPVLTEKAAFGEAKGVYTFEITDKANKISVKKAIKELYGVRPVKVNIIRVKGKAVRYGRTTGRTKNWKKAIVFLKKGDKIEFVKK